MSFQILFMAEFSPFPAHTNHKLNYETFKFLHISKVVRHHTPSVWKFPLQFPTDNCSLAARERGHISPSPPSLQYIKHWPDLSLTSPTRALGLCNFFLLCSGGGGMVSDQLKLIAELSTIDTLVTLLSLQLQLRLVLSTPPPPLS